MTLKLDGLKKFKTKKKVILYSTMKCKQRINKEKTARSKRRYQSDNKPEWGLKKLL